MMLQTTLTTVLLLACGTLPAQTDQDARITVTHPGIDALKSDLAAILELTSPEEQAQQENVDGYIDSFAMGLATEKPVTVAVPLGGKPASVLLGLEYRDFDEFRDNLDSIGFTFDRDTDPMFYGMKSDPDYSWMRKVKDSKQLLLLYASALAEDEAVAEKLTVPNYQKKLMAELRQVIAAAVFPTSNASGNLIAQVTNSNGTADAQVARRKSFAAVRAGSMDAIQKRPDESVSELALRERTASNLLDEVERVIAEVEMVSAVLTLDKASATGMTAVVNTSLKAIPGTTLANSISLFHTQPDAFASVPKAEGSALSFRMNHPVDPMRQTNALEVLTLTEKDMAARLAASTELSAEEKAATLTLTQTVLSVISDSIRSGYMNLMIEAVPDGQGEFVSISAFSAPSAAKLGEVLPTLASAGKGNVVEMNVATVGTVSVHRVQLATGYSDFMDKAFGEKKDIFIGIGPAHIWLASGPGSLDQLKATIEGMKEPVAGGSPLHIELKLLPWIQKADRLAKLRPEAESTDDKEIQREQARKRARAITAFADADNVTLDFQVKDGDVQGELKLDTGILRYVGKEMAAFSKKNFE